MSYTGNTPSQREEMLSACGVKDINELFKAIPDNLRARSLNLSPGKSELETFNHLKNLSEKNYSHLTSFLGGGFYDHFIPAAIDALASRSEFYTAYTPYQPELSQGTLQAIYEYQTDMCGLTDMDVSNASMYDGGTALFEACQTAIKVTKRNRVVIDGNINPIYKKMLSTYMANLSIELCEIEANGESADRKKLFGELNSDTAAVIVQNPNFFGCVDDYTDVADRCAELGIISIISVYPVSLGILKTPGEMNFDICTGEGQSLGIPLSFGGPYLGFFTSKKKLARKIPGRIAGKTTDTHGKQGFVLTLQAREQHIRREKATSNICSNQALCALRAHMYLSLIGKDGLKKTALLCFEKAEYAKTRLEAVPGVEIVSNAQTFNEFAVRLPGNAGEIAGKMIEQGFAAGFPLGRYFSGMDDRMLISVTEKRTKSDIGRFAESLEEIL